MAWFVSAVWSWSWKGDVDVWDTAESDVEFLEGLGYDGWRMADTNDWSGVVDLDALEWIKTTPILRHVLSAAEV